MLGIFHLVFVRSQLVLVSLMIKKTEFYAYFYFCPIQRKRQGISMGTFNMIRFSNRLEFGPAFPIGLSKRKHPSISIAVFGTLRSSYLIIRLSKVSFE